MNDIAVIDYGMGNLRSVSKALEQIAPDARVLVTSDPHIVHHAQRVVFPGQGAMPDCMREMEARGLHQAIVESAKTKPFLGICIGMQMLFQHSEEGNVDGVGLLAGNVVRFAPAAMVSASGEKLKVPHMGWNEVQQNQAHPLWAGIANESRFYFVHSYYCQPAAPDCIVGVTHYPFAFASAVARDNIFAVQFHPEKSAAAGLALLSNFVRWDGGIKSSGVHATVTHAARR